MWANPKSFLKNSANILFILVFFILAGGCEYDHKALIEKTLDAREKAWNTKNIDLYMEQVSPVYQYKPDSKQSLRDFLTENLLIWDSVHIHTYNKLIYIDGEYAKVTQDFQMSVEKKGKTSVFSGAEAFVLKKHGYFSPRWLFVSGLDN